MSWSEDNDYLSKEFRFRDFDSALEFVNKIGSIASEQAHHPDIFLSWGNVKVSLTTHSEKSITEKDYQLASAIDKLVVK